MYAAVYARGPRWESVETQGIEGPERYTYDIDRPLISDEQLLQLQAELLQKNLTLEQIEARLDGN